MTAATGPPEPSVSHDSADAFERIASFTYARGVGARRLLRPATREREAARIRRKVTERPERSRRTSSARASSAGDA